MGKHTLSMKAWLRQMNQNIQVPSSQPLLPSPKVPVDHLRPGHEVEHLPEGHLEVHLSEEQHPPQVLPPLGRRRHAALVGGGRGEARGRGGQRRGGAGQELQPVLGVHGEGVRSGDIRRNLSEKGLGRLLLGSWRMTRMVMSSSSWRLQAWALFFRLELDFFLLFLHFVDAGRKKIQ